MAMFNSYVKLPEGTVQGIVFTFILQEQEHTDFSSKECLHEAGDARCFKAKYLGVSLTEDTSNIDGIHAMMDSALRVPLV